MKRFLPLLVLIAFAPLAGSAAAADKIVGTVAAGEADGAKITFVNYAYASCEEECQVATLTCLESTSIALEVADVETAIAAKAITQEKNQIVMKAGGKSFDYSIGAMKFAEMTGAWWLTAREQGSAPLDIAKAIATSKTVELQIGKTKIALPVDKAIKAWALACK
jgi:hypothetical protein